MIRQSEHAPLPEHAKRGREDLLLRVGVASFLWVNVMLLNFAVYAGVFGGMPVQIRPYLPFVVAALTAPVVLYSAAPLFRLACRGLMNRVIRMEALLAKNKQRTLSPAKQRELKALLQECDAVMLRRATALDRIA